MEQVKTSQTTRSLSEIHFDCYQPCVSVGRVTPNKIDFPFLIQMELNENRVFQLKDQICQETTAGHCTYRRPRTESKRKHNKQSRLSMIVDDGIDDLVFVTSMRSVVACLLRVPLSRNFPRV